MMLVFGAGGKAGVHGSLTKNSNMLRLLYGRVNNGITSWVEYDVKIASWQFC
jgi:hypothetical protein